MNKVVKEIQKIMEQNIAFYLPHVRESFEIDKNDKEIYTMKR